MIQMAVEQFLPSVAAGTIMTLLLVRSVPSVLWMLPGLWQIIFSLGVFASCRFLSRAMVAVGVWYLSAGTRLDCAWTWPCTFTLDNGCCLWNRAVFSCRYPDISQRKRAEMTAKSRVRGSAVRI